VHSSNSESIGALALGVIVVSMALHILRRAVQQTLKESVSLEVDEVYLTFLFVVPRFCSSATTSFPYDGMICCLICGTESREVSYICQTEGQRLLQLISSYPVPE